MNERNQAKPDWILIISIVIQLIIGTVFIHSITSANESSNQGYVFRYLAHLLFSLVYAWFVLRFVSVERIKKASYWCLGIAFILIAATLMPGIGLELNGASRLIRIGSTNHLIAPLATFFLIISTSRFLADHYDQSKPPKNLSTKIIVPFVFLFFIFMSQPDVVSFCILTILLVILCYSAKFFKESLQIILITFVSFAILILSEPYRRERFFAFLEPFEHQYDLTWQLSNNLLKIAAGNLSGQGYGQSFLPASPDLGGFVFATIVEETGFFGGSIVILCSLIIMWRSFSIAQNCFRTHRIFEGILVIGITSWITLASLIHIASSTGLIPTVSVYYPFLSYAKGSLGAAIFAYALVIRVGMMISVPVERKRINTQPLFSLFAGLFMVLGYHIFDLAVLDKNLDQRYLHRVEILQNIKLEQQKRKGIFIDDFCSENKGGKLICTQQRRKNADRRGLILASLKQSQFDHSLFGKGGRTND